jgi:glycosyltransferase involved in cell wall biosynthesis
LALGRQSDWTLLLRMSTTQSVDPGCGERTEASALCRILLIGALPPPYGGTTVSFQQLVTELAQHNDVKIEVIDTSRGEDTGGIFRDTVAAIRISWQVVRALGRSDVATLHASTPGIINFGLILFAFCRFSRVPLVVRAFGGSLENDYDEISPLARWVIRVVFRTNRVLLQTRSLTEYFSSKFPRSNCEWYSNSRPLSVDTNNPRVVTKPASSFVYVGHVKTSKGLQEIIEAAEKLEGLNFQVDVYGPLLEGFTACAFDGSRRVAYRGVLKPEEVIPTLRRYDVVLLPTYHFGEGYPGIVIEAYMAGRPVITTRWQAIPEIVEHGVSGLLVEPANVDDLARAMSDVCQDVQLLRELTEGSRAIAHKFSSERWTEKFVEICRQVASERSLRISRGT